MERPTDRSRVLVAYLRPGRRQAMGLAVALLAMTALPLIGPQLLRRFVDQAASGRPVSLLVGTAGAYLVVAVATQGVTVLATYATSLMAWATTNRLREDLTEHALGLDIAFHGERTPGEMIERVDGDVTALAEFFSQFVLNMLGSALLLLGTLIIVWFERWQIGLLLTIFTTVGGVALWRARARAVPAATAEREAVAQLMGNLEERLVAAEDIRANGAGAHVINRFHEAIAVVYRAALRSGQAVGLLIGVSNLFFGVTTAAVLVAGITLVGRGQMTIGTVVLLFQYTQMVRRPLEQITDQLKQFQVASAGAARAARLFAVQPTITNRPGGGSLLPAGALSVQFDHVTFAYGADDAVLDDVSIEIPAGRSLGLVGRSGSGKTTIARLLLRLYDSPDGGVLIGGVDIRDVALTDLRRRVGMVTQDVQLFAADLRDNLTMFRGGVPDGRLVDVINDLGLGRWFSALPDGLDTVLGPGGSGLSAGEAQLVAFARVFLSDPGIVVLDEASSRLDPGTEVLIDRAVDALLVGRTAVIIAHRLSSLDRVDDIAVIEHGRVVEYGAREDLVADATSRFAGLLSAAGLAT